MLRHGLSIGQGSPQGDAPRPGKQLGPLPLPIPRPHHLPSTCSGLTGTGESPLNADPDMSAFALDLKCLPAVAIIPGSTKPLRETKAMAHSLSAKKRIRQNLRHRARNRWRKQQVRDAVKEYREAIMHASVEDAEQKLRGLYKLLDQAAAKGTFHKNTASRTKARLAARLEQKKKSEGQAA